MKQKLLAVFVSFFLTINLAQAYRFHNSDQNCNGDCQYCTTCQCTDLGAGRNGCMSLSKYCEAFGNIGAR